MIKDIHVNNFRLFTDFEMSNLARVNLIAGKNNVGKSTLLDALDLLLTKGDHLTFQELFQRRMEFIVHGDISYDVNHLFAGRHLKNRDQITISANQGQRIIKINFVVNEVVDAPVEDYIDAQRHRMLPRYELNTHYGEDLTLRYYLDDHGILTNMYPFGSGIDVKDPSLYVTTEGIDMTVLSTIWDEIGLSPERDYVLRMLNVLDPDVSEIQFLTSGQGIRIRHKLFNKPIPLASMGDGMSRILGIAMSMATLKNGYLMIDEIDTGLHYRTITDMWKLVITAAKELNVQVFATTHSQDCIISFSEAMEELEDDKSGAYFRLQNRGEKIQAVRYDAGKLARALRSRGEVR